MKQNQQDDFTKILSNLSETQIVTEQITPDKYKISCPFYAKVDDGDEYEIFLISDNEKFYLSDEGATYRELDKIFELAESDVIRNLTAIMERFGCSKHSSKDTENVIIIECTPKNVFSKLGHLVQTCSFMLNMRIFYVY